MGIDCVVQCGTGQLPVVDVGCHEYVGPRCLQPTQHFDNVRERNLTHLQRISQLSTIAAEGIDEVGARGDLDGHVGGEPPDCVVPILRASRAYRDQHRHVGGFVWCTGALRHCGQHPGEHACVRTLADLRETLGLLGIEHMTDVGSLRRRRPRDDAEVERKTRRRTVVLAKKLEPRAHPSVVGRDLLDDRFGGAVVDEVPDLRERFDTQTAGIGKVSGIQVVQLGNDDGDRVRVDMCVVEAAEYGRPSWPIDGRQ